MFLLYLLYCVIVVEAAFHLCGVLVFIDLYSLQSSKGCKLVFSIYFHNNENIKILSYQTLIFGGLFVTNILRIISVMLQACT